MPKGAAFAEAQAQAARFEVRPYHYAIFFLLFAVPLILVHLFLLNLPFFWDEHGQFVPTALDILRRGAWVARSTIPNVHPPGVEAYLALWYKVAGYSIPITRLAMLAMASAGMLATFLLAVELSKEAKGAPAFLPPLLLMASPLFYTQSMMAQLDMPAMVFTILALLFFVRKQYAASALTTIALVLAKETGILVPAIFFALLVWRGDRKRAAYFVPSAAALAVWLVVLHHRTGYWLGNSGFAHYNVGYALDPVRMLFAFARRLYYLFIADFRWIGTAAMIIAARRNPAFFRFFKTQGWQVTLLVSAATVVLVSVLGGAELERYVLPVLPIFYIAVSIGITFLPRWGRITATTALFAGLIVSLFWNPPYPFPYENNFAMVDFVRLQQTAAHFAENNLRGATIATAWPFTAGLRSADYGFVNKPLHVLETRDFHIASIESIPPAKFDALITYSRIWEPDRSVLDIGLVRKFLTRYFDYQPGITAQQCQALGLVEVASWSLGGQQIDIYVRGSELQAAALRN
jgi:hypothetical protein